MPWTALIFQSIPEEIILVTLGLALVGEYPRMSLVSVTGTLIAVFSFFFRRLPLDFGVHTLVQIIVFIILLRIITRANFFKGTLAAILGTLALGVIEGISIPIILYITGISFETALHDPWLRVLFPLPDEIILGLVAYFCRKRNFSLIPKDILTVKPGKDKEDEK